MVIYFYTDRELILDASIDEDSLIILGEGVYVTYLRYVFIVGLPIEKNTI